MADLVIDEENIELLIRQITEIRDLTAQAQQRLAALYQTISDDRRWIGLGSAETGALLKLLNRYLRELTGETCMLGKDNILSKSLLDDIGAFGDAPLESLLYALKTLRRESDELVIAQPPFAAFSGTQHRNENLEDTRYWGDRGYK